MYSLKLNHYILLFNHSLSYKIDSIHEGKINGDFSINFDLFGMDKELAEILMIDFSLETLVFKKGENIIFDSKEQDVNNIRVSIDINNKIFNVTIILSC